MVYQFFIVVCLAIATSSSAFSTSYIRNHISMNSRSALRMSTEPVVDVDSSSAATADDSEYSATDDISMELENAGEEAASTAFKPKKDLSYMYAKPELRKAPRQAQWFPLLLSPEALDGTMAGDVGFDPLGFAKDKSALAYFREAEIKHCRLAMLAAAGWPMSELWHVGIADTLGLDSILAAEGRAPSVLNGGLSNEWIIGAAAFSLVVGGLLEFKTMDSQKKDGYRPGELSFDPLGLYAFRSYFGLDQITEKITREEKLARARFDMDLCEIKNGRLAMLAITAYAAQEYLSGIPVVQQTPFFFGDPIV
jgi:hypothetical protein